jgi:hypothetical protein
VTPAGGPTGSLASVTLAELAVLVGKLTIGTDTTVGSESEPIPEEGPRRLTRLARSRP